jgi:hypothetical protein
VWFLRYPLFFYQVDKPIEKIPGIMRARSMLRMILDGKSRVFFMPHPFTALIVQVDMR